MSFTSYVRVSLMAIFKAAADQPEIVLAQEAEVAIVNVESKVIVVAVECDDLALWVGRHPLEEDALVVFQGFDPLFLLCFPAELHLMEQMIHRQC